MKKIMLIALLGVFGQAQAIMSVGAPEAGFISDGWGDWSLSEYASLGHDPMYGDTGGTATFTPITGATNLNMTSGATFGQFNTEVTTVANNDLTLDFWWDFGSDDADWWTYDSAGFYFIHNDVQQTAFTADSSMFGNVSTDSLFGLIDLNIQAGDSFGFGMYGYSSYLYGESWVNIGINSVSLRTSYPAVDTGPGGNVPEPSILALFGLGLVGLGAVRRRKTI